MRHFSPDRSFFSARRYWQLLLPYSLLSYCTIILFLLHLSGAVLPAQTQTSVPPEPLLSRNNRFDYLIITPSQFAGDVQAHAQWRSTPTWTHPALRTRIVTLEEINREFGDSTKKLPQSQAEAIRAFISYTLQYWTKPEPSRIMLVGSTNFLPAYRIKVGIFTEPEYIRNEDSIPMDEWYVVNAYRQDFNTRPQAAIGRIPGRTSEEIRRVLGKVRLFEESGNTLGYDMTTRATVILDAEDNEGFDDQVFLLRSFLDSNIKKPLPMSIVNFLTIALQPDARRQVTNAMGASRPIVMYYGHGAPGVWSKYSILTTDDVGNNLPRNGKPFMLITAGCSQNYDLPLKPSIVEALMLLENGGTAMTVASSGYSRLQENNAFIRLYFQELFTKQIDVGTAIMNAKNALFSGGLQPQDDLIRRIALLGDPAMIPFSRLATSVRDRSASLPAEPIAIAPNPSSSQVTLQYSLAESGDVRIDIVNLLGQTALSIRQQQSAGQQSVNISTETLASGTYLCRLFAGGTYQSALLTIHR